MKKAMMFLLLAAVAMAALEQSYLQEVDRDGTSKITRTMDISIVAGQLGSDDLESMAHACRTAEMQCSVDTDNKIVTITEDFEVYSAYYSFSTEGGLPFTTHTLVIKRIPTDRFASAFDRLLSMADVSAPPATATPAIDLKEDNSELAYYLRLLKMNMTYTVEMPGEAYEATAGDVSASIEGSKAAFDLVEVLEERQQMTVKSRELNFPYILLIAAVLVLGGLAVYFHKTAKRRRIKPA